MSHLRTDNFEVSSFSCSPTNTQNIENDSAEFAVTFHDHQSTVIGVASESQSSTINMYPKFSSTTRAKNLPPHDNTSNNIAFKFPCLLINAQSIVNKMVELTSLANSLKPKIIAITETWCKDSIGDAEICSQNYVLHTLDQN